MISALIDKTTGPYLGLRSSRGRAIAAFCLLVVFYFTASVTNRAEAIDTVMFSLDAETAPLWSTPDARMVLFYRLNRLAFHAAEGLGLNLSVYTVLGFIGALFAAGSVLLLYRLLRRAFMLSEPASIAGALTLGASFGFWRYANEVEVYIGATFLILLSLNLLLDRIGKSTFTAGQAALLGTASGLAVAYYQPTAFALFFAAAVLFIKWRHYIQYLAYGAAGVGIYMMTIAVSLWMVHRHIPGIHDLALILTERTSEFERPSFGITSFAKAGFAILHDLASLTWLYGVPGVEDLIARSMPYHHYHSEKIFFAARNFGLLWIAAGTFLAAMAWLAYIAAAAIRERQRRPIDVAIVFVLAWLAFASATNLVLNPAENEVWIINLPALAILIAVFIYEPLRARPWQLAVMVGLLFAHNLIGGIGFFRNDKGDLYARSTSWIREHGERGDLILRTGDHRDWADGMRILHYPIAHKPDMTGKDLFFRFIYFYGTTAVDQAEQNWKHHIELTPSEMLRILKTTGKRIFVLDRALNPRPVPPGPDCDERNAKLVAFGDLLKAYATLVDDGPDGKTFEIDKTRLPDSWPPGG